jgi:hypothetical protein
VIVGEHDERPVGDDGVQVMAREGLVVAQDVVTQALAYQPGLVTVVVGK